MQCAVRLQTEEIHSLPAFLVRDTFGSDDCLDTCMLLDTEHLQEFILLFDFDEEQPIIHFPFKQIHKELWNVVILKLGMQKGAMHEPSSSPEVVWFEVQAAIMHI